MLNNDIANHLKTSMSGKRYQHTLGVAGTAKKLAEIHGADRDKAETAALLHDAARDFNHEYILQMCQKYNITADEVEKAVPNLLHAKIGAYMAGDIYGIKDSEVLDAIRFHTTGRKNMSILEKIIFIADMIEPGRDFPGVEDLRELAFKNLDKAVITGLDSTLRYVIERGLLIHTDSIEARNHLLGC